MESAFQHHPINPTYLRGVDPLPHAAAIQTMLLSMPRSVTAFAPNYYHVTGGRGGPANSCPNDEMGTGQDNINRWVFISFAVFKCKNHQTYPETVVPPRKRSPGKLKEAVLRARPFKDERESASVCQSTSKKLFGKCCPCRVSPWMNREKGGERTTE